MNILLSECAGSWKRLRYHTRETVFLKLPMRRNHYLRANVYVLFCNVAHILPHQNEFLDLPHKSSEKGPPMPRDRDKSYYEDTEP